MKQNNNEGIEKLIKKADKYQDGYLAYGKMGEEELRDILEIALNSKEKEMLDKLDKLFIEGKLRKCYKDITLEELKQKLKGDKK